MMGRPSILLTGANGFLGRVFLHELRPGFQVITLGRSKSNAITVDLAKEIPNLNESFDCVIHAAGKAHSIPKSEADVAEFFQVNLRGTINLVTGLERLQKLPASLVFISTVAVYGLETGELIDEASPLIGHTPYASSKIQAEAYLTEWCQSKGIMLTILRLPLVVGIGAPGNLGAMIQLMRKGLYVGIGTGAARKSMVLATDLARFIPEIASRGGVYNLTDGFHPSMNEFEAALASRLGKSAPLRLPVWFLRGVAGVGDILGDWFPLNSLRLRKLTDSLTFSDAKARQAGWQPHSVIENLPQDL